MPSSVTLFSLLIALVAAERLWELHLSRRNRRWAMQRGGKEYGQAHYPLMVLLHSGVLLFSLLEVWWCKRPFVPWRGGSMLVLVAASMALRYWVIASLGPQWNTRVIVVPGMPLVHSGPYRWLRHPNYLAVVVELAALPLVHSAWCTAAVASLANAWLLWRVRRPIEERALQHAPNC